MIDHKFTNPDYCFSCGNQFGQHNQRGGITHHKTQKGTWVTGYKCQHCTSGQPYHPDQLQRWETQQQNEAIEVHPKPMAAPGPRLRMLDIKGKPTNRHPDFQWLAIYIEHTERLKDLFGNFKSFRQWVSGYGYRYQDIEKAIAHRKEQLA